MGLKMDRQTISLLETALRKREALKGCTNALRLVNGLGDGLKGLVLEQYDRHFVAQIFDRRWLKEKEALIRFVKTRCDAQYLIIKDRSDVPFSEVFKTSVWIEGDVSKTIVQENGLKFEVDLNDTLNSGLFLDMRRNRKLIGALARGRKVLNCFAYTCSFGVYCRFAGALSAVNVDISPKSLSRGRTNYELNRLIASENEFIRADAVQYIKRALVKGNFFDIIILDPPSFARHEGKTFSVKKDLAQLIDSAIKILNPSGILFVSTNFSGFSHDHLEKMVRAAAFKRRIKKIERLGQDEDFKRSFDSAPTNVGAPLRISGSETSRPLSYLAALLVKF